MEKKQITGKDVMGGELKRGGGRNIEKNEGNVWNK
jgi:hypothetical protein